MNAEEGGGTIQELVTISPSFIQVLFIGGINRHSPHRVRPLNHLLKIIEIYGHAVEIDK